MNFLANENFPLLSIKRLRGIVYFRFDPATPLEPGNLLLELMSSEKINITGKFTVIDRKRIRQRPLPIRKMD